MITGLLVLAALFVAGSARAHERIVSGKYAFVLGWLDEPPIVGLKNAAYVEVSLAADGAPVAGAESTLTARIEFGGRARDLILRPVEGTPGAYAGDFIPTRRGTYTLILAGAIDAQPIDVRGEIEEVASAASLEFPEAQPGASDLQQSLDALRGEVSSARAFAVAGLAIGAIGLVLAAAAFGRKKRDA
jgi:hypothetical protein